MASPPPTFGQRAKAQGRRMVDGFTSYFRKPGDAPQRGSSAAGKLVASCPLAGQAAVAAPPAPKTPCNLAELQAQLRIVRGDDVEPLPPFKSAGAVAMTPSEVAAINPALNAAEKAIVDQLGTHAIVVSVLSPFAARADAPSATNRLSDLNALAEVHLRGQVTSTYEAICGEVHPVIEYRTNTEGSIRRGGVLGREIRVYAEATRALATNANNARKRIDAAAERADAFLKRFTDLPDIVVAAANALQAKTNAEIAADGTVTSLTTVPTGETPAQKITREAALAQAKVTQTSARNAKLAAAAEHAMLVDEKTNATALKPFTTRLRAAAVTLDAAAETTAKAAEKARNRVAGFEAADAGDVAALRRVAVAAERDAAPLRDRLEVMATWIEARVAPPPPPAPPAPGAPPAIVLPGRPLPQETTVPAAEAFVAGHEGAVTAATSAATALLHAANNAGTAYAATPPPVVWTDRLQTSEDTLQAIGMTVRTAGFDIEWLRARWWKPWRWFDLSSTRREVTVTATSCGYAASGTGRPDLSALLYLEGMSDFSFELQYRGLRWGWSESVSQQAATAGGPHKDVHTKGSYSTVGAQRESSETTHTRGWQDGRLVTDRSKTKTVSIDDRSNRVASDPDPTETIASPGVTVDKSLLEDPPLEGAAKKVDDAIATVDANLAKAFMNGMFSARVIANGRTLDTDEIADLLVSLQETANTIRAILDILAETGKTGAQLAFPVQLVAGFRAEISVLVIAANARIWHEVDPARTLAAERHYIQRFERRFELRFDVTLFEGKLVLYAGVELKILHSYIASLSLKVELGIGGKLRVMIPLVTHNSATRAFTMNNRLLASLGVVATANAGPLFVEVKGELEGSIDFFWDLVWTHGKPAAPPTAAVAGHLDLMRCDLIANGIKPKFTVSAGSKLKIPWTNGRTIGGAWSYELPDPPTTWLGPKDLYSYDKGAAQTRKAADTAAEAQRGTDRTTNTNAQKTAAQAEADARHKRRN